MIQTTTGVIPGPFAGRSINCRQCHFVDDAVGIPGGRSLTYGDFARRSPIPDRGDGFTTTARNSPPLVNASLGRSTPFLLHFDGEFASGPDLVRGTFTGRNFGWLATEHDAAVAHLALVIRQDDGTNEFAADTGGLSYATLLLGGPGVPPELLIPAARRIDVTTATDLQILDAVAALVNDYLEHLEFSRAANGDFNGSPFDAFVRRNNLPAHPDAGESDLAFLRRLRSDLDAVKTLRFVGPGDGELLLHQGQPFVFGPGELAGLRIFLAEPGPIPASGGVGNCLACHQGPQFNDFLAHNVGTTQEEYESVHGLGTLAALSIPDLAVRSLNEDLYLPPTSAHPTRMGTFKRVPDAADPLHTDLGLWSMLANPDVPNPQSALFSVICAAGQVDPGTTTTAQALDLSVALFKTAGLRSLGQGAPYFHTGQFDSLEGVVNHYRTFATRARIGEVRNADPRLANIFLEDGDVAPLVAFLKSLNEDYQ